MPDGLVELGGRGSVAAMRVFLYLLRASGRLAAIYRAKSQAEQHRMILALFVGPERIRLDLTDRKIAEDIGRSRRCTQLGLAALVRGGYLEIHREGRRRILALRLPAEGGDT